MLQDRETVLKGTQLGDVASSDRPLDEERDALDRVDADAAVLSEVKLKRALTDIEAARGRKEKREAEEARARKELQEARAAVRSRAREAAAGAAPGAEKGPSPKLPLPFLDVETLGIKGRWEESGGNFVLRPPAGARVRALVHFLGGAFVGAAPHLAYKYLLEGLADKGFLVVATPYPLDFEYLETCDAILAKFEKAAIPLAREYGRLPVVGVGHSCGALLQLLITSLFPDTPRAGNAIISFNNKPASEAIPGFEQAIVPLVTAALAPETEEAAERQRQLGETFALLRGSLLALAEAGAELPVVPAFVARELLPLSVQSASVIDQIPGIFKSIADGAREFTPSPDETKEVIRRLYRARRTLLIKFTDDTLDETDDIQEALAAAKAIYRMKRPMASLDLAMKEVTGTHVTPLTQDIFLRTPLDDVDPLFSVREGAREGFLATVDAVLEELVAWLEEGLRP